jgi:hypothetical protein
MSENSNNRNVQIGHVGTCTKSSPSPSSSSPPPLAKSELEQHNVIRMQQMEAIRLIQISLDKLSSTTTVQLPKPKQSSSTTHHQASNTSTILVYKESNLHKNLLVSKILNKAKYFYYQSIVQTMRLSLISKLNYYSSLVQQLNARNSADETSIVDEMKHLMDQILHETYQFNMNSSADDQINLSTHVLPNVVANPIVSSQQQSQPKQQPEQTITNNKNSKRFNHISVYDDEVNSKSTTSSIQRHDEQLQNEKNKRIKQLNDVKISLYSLLFANNSTNGVVEDKKSKVEHLETTTSADSENKHFDKKVTTNFSNKQLNNFKKRLLDRKKDPNTIANDSVNKRPRKMSNDYNLILADDTNVFENRFIKKNKRVACSAAKTNIKFKRLNAKAASPNGTAARITKQRPTTTMTPHYAPLYKQECPLV